MIGGAISALEKYLLSKAPELLSGSPELLKLIQAKKYAQAAGLGGGMAMTKAGKLAQNYPKSAAFTGGGLGGYMLGSQDDEEELPYGYQP